MNKLTRIAVTMACLLLAMVCYLIGIPAGSFVFLILGVGFELLFWFGVFGGIKKPEKA